MKSELTQARIEELRTRIDEILFYKWDPLKSSSGNFPRDEYSHYVDPILTMMVNEASAAELTKHLSKLRQRAMCMAANDEVDSSVANLIHAIVNDDDYCPDHIVFTVD